MAIELLNGLQGSLGAVPSNWSIALTGDFNGNRKSDIFGDTNTGTVTISSMNGLQIFSSAGLGAVAADSTIQEINAAWTATRITTRSRSFRA